MGLRRAFISSKESTSTSARSCLFPIVSVLPRVTKSTKSFLNLESFPFTENEMNQCLLEIMKGNVSNLVWSLCKSLV